MTVSSELRRFARSGSRPPPSSSAGPPAAAPGRRSAPTPTSPSTVSWDTTPTRRRRLRPPRRHHRPGRATPSPPRPRTVAVDNSDPPSAPGRDASPRRALYALRGRHRDLRRHRRDRLVRRGRDQLRPAHRHRQDPLPRPDGRLLAARTPATYAFGDLSGAPGGDGLQRRRSSPPRPRSRSPPTPPSRPAARSTTRTATTPTATVTITVDARHGRALRRRSRLERVLERRTSAPLRRFLRPASRAAGAR